MPNALKIYSFPLSGHSHRVILFASLAGIAHEVIDVDLANGEHKKPPYLSINPAGQVPAIVRSGYGYSRDRKCRYRGLWR